jgi:hypothetical protein
MVEVGDLRIPQQSCCRVLDNMTGSRPYGHLRLLQQCMLACGCGGQVRLLRCVPLLLPLLPVLLLLRMLRMLLMLLREGVPRSVGRRIARQDRHSLGGALSDPPVPHRPPALVRPLLLRHRLLPRYAVCSLVALWCYRWCRLRPRSNDRRAADGAVLLPLQP